MFTGAYTQSLLTGTDTHRYGPTDTHSQIHSTGSDKQTLTDTHMNA